MRLAVVGDGELIGLESFHRLAGAIGDFDVDAHQIGGRAKYGLRGLGGGLLSRAWGCGVWGRRLLLCAERHGRDAEAGDDERHD